jgi:hypothetical protein
MLRKYDVREVSPPPNVLLVSNKKQIIVKEILEFINSQKTQKIKIKLL